jgi:YHS domain-containing protein
MPFIRSLIAAMFLISLAGCAGDSPKENGTSRINSAPVAGPDSTEMVVMKDPICGHVLTPKTVVAKSVYKNVTYYFCATGCKIKFDKNPEMYIAHR